MTAYIDEWLKAAPDEREREFRQAVHTVLVAISSLRREGLDVVMKGGILLAVEYAGDRFTRDVDFSTRALPADIPPDRYLTSLNASLAAEAQQLPYGLACRVQSSKLEPPGADKLWPTLELRVGYAPLTHARRSERLAKGKSNEIVTVEISYNEVITDVAMIDVGNGREILASTLADLAAEKYRAMIQQPIRNRFRRQDAYDLHWLIESRGDEMSSRRPEILDALRKKAAGRGVEVIRESLRNPEVERRSRVDYPTLADEVRRPLPDFDQVYTAVRDFYESLPW